MPDRVIDYTTMRLGSRPDGGRRRVVRCPVCGLKGVERPPFIDQRGRPVSGYVIHRMTVAFGLPSAQSGDWCYLPAEPAQEG